MPATGKLAHAHVANVLTVILVVLLAGALINAEATSRRYRIQATDAELLLRRERLKVRMCVARRLSCLENRVDAIAPKEVKYAYQARLADVRHRFAFGMCGQAPAAPVAPVSMPVAVPTARPDAACPFSEEEAMSARATAQQLAALQAWVRENMGDMK